MWLVWVLSLLLAVTISFTCFADHLSTSVTAVNGQSSVIFQLRGGAKKKPSFGSMFKAFWTTLLNPASEEDLRQEIKTGQASKSTKSSRGLFGFGSKKKKGRKVSD